MRPLCAKLETCAAALIVPATIAPAPATHAVEHRSPAPRMELIRPRLPSSSSIAVAPLAPTRPRVGRAVVGTMRMTPPDLTSNASSLLDGLPCTLS
eukprot:1488685-Prymnesium_polylepis.3